MKKWNIVFWSQVTVEPGVEKDWEGFFKEVKAIEFTKSVKWVKMVDVVKNETFQGGCGWEWDISGRGSSVGEALR